MDAANCWTNPSNTVMFCAQLRLNFQHLLLVASIRDFVKDYGPPGSRWERPPPRSVPNHLFLYPPPQVISPRQHSFFVKLSVPPDQHQIRETCSLSLVVQWQQQLLAIAFPSRKDLKWFKNMRYWSRTFWRLFTSSSEPIPASTDLSIKLIASNHNPFSKYCCWRKLNRKCSSQRNPHQIIMFFISH